MRTGKWLAWLLACAVCLAVAAPAQAQPAGDDKAFEKSLDAALRDVINQGAAIFNQQGDYAGCYRLYQGALLTVRPLLFKNVELQAFIDRGMADAGAMARVDERAHALRKVLDEIRYTFNASLRPAAKTLWERLGGEKGVEKVIAELIEAAGTDPRVNFDRGGKYAFNKTQLRILQKGLVEFVSAATGGPLKYTGPSMKEVHRGMGITGDEFDALAGHLKKVLEKNGVKSEDVEAVLKGVGSTRSDIVAPEPKKGIDKIDEKKDFKDDKKEVKKEVLPDPKKQIEEKKPETKGVKANPNMAQITGKVTLKGKPLNYGFVTFIDADGRSFSANITSNGDFAFRAGIPPANYVVIVEGTTSPPEPGEIRAAIPQQYQSAATSGLRYSPKKGANAFNIDLK